MSRRQKEVLFERGAEAAQRVLGSSGLYYCPICSTGYDKSAIGSGDLTLEHVPPAARGGKGIALTCRYCNNTAGHTVDAAMSQRAEQSRFADLILGESSDYRGFVALELGGERVNVEVSRHNNGKINLNVIDKINDPRVVERVSQYLYGLAQDGRGDGETFQVTSRIKYQWRLAQIGDLRAAFLVAFAALGYGYIFHDRLRSIRKQILHPDQQVINGWTVALTEANASSYLILITQSPISVLIKLKGIGVLLPWIGSPQNFYDTLKVTYPQNEQIQLNGALVPWPTTLEMALDFHISAAPSDET